MLNSNSVLQILDLLRRIQENASNSESLIIARHKATQAVAQQQPRPIRYQTIEDLYRRRLGLTRVSEFDALAQNWVSGNPDPLMELLRRHADPATHNDIAQFFLNNSHATMGSPKTAATEPQDSKSESFPVVVSEKEARILRFIADMKHLDPTKLLSQLVSRAIRNEMKTLAQNIL